MKISNKTDSAIQCAALAYKASTAAISVTAGKTAKAITATTSPGAYTYIYINTYCFIYFYYILYIVLPIQLQQLQQLDQ